MTNSNWLKSAAILLITLAMPTFCAISSFSYHPKGNNAPLYEPEVDPIMHLDGDTFVDTVLNPRKDRAVLVEFYKDWCGYCRRLVPYYKQLAATVKNWPFVQVATINCADAYNVKICRANDIPTVPKIKFFPRKASKFSDGQVIEHSHSAMEMREKLNQKIMDEFNAEDDLGHYLGQMPYNEKCDLRSLCRKDRVKDCTGKSILMQDPWARMPEQTKYQAIVFEQQPDKGIKLTLDLLSEKPFVEVKRVFATPEQVVMPQGQHLPFVALIEKGKLRPLLAESFNGNTMSRIESLLQPMMEKLNATETEEAHEKKQYPVVDCQREPEKCKEMFFVSEVDMLKAIRTALLDEVLSSGEVVADENFENLRNFVSFVLKRFPQKSNRDRVNGGAQNPRFAVQSTLGVPLDRSQRAMKVVSHLKDLLDSRTANKRISTDEWKKHFEDNEKSEGNPFPMDAPWEHCRGSTRIFRGFTCGLWTAFHTMAVQAYLGKEMHPLESLKSIQGWVKSFFGCSGCRKHFMTMTTEKFPMVEAHVRKPEDIVLYLWKAHNIVNNRLHGDETTEDPQFVKGQFPPNFLCADCHVNEGKGFDEGKTLKFLVDFGTNIKPYREQT